jgi:hypothetical protein
VDDVSEKTTVSFKSTSCRIFLRAQPRRRVSDHLQKNQFSPDVDTSKDQLEVQPRV